MSVFTDSGGWLSVLVTNDRYHQIGKHYLESLIQAKIVLLATDYVLDEVVTRLRYDTGYKKAVEFLDLVRQAEARGVLQISPVTRELRGRAEEIFRQYKDVTHDSRNPFGNNRNT